MSVAGRARLAALVALLFAVVVTGCPSRDLKVAVTEAGLTPLAAACEGFAHACETPDACTLDSAFCAVSAGGSCGIDHPCALAGHPAWHPGAPKAAALLLLDANQSPAKSQAKSKCMLLFASCTANDAGTDVGVGPRVCLAAEMNDHIDQALVKGLSFGGFRAPDDAVLAMAIFEPKAGAADPCAEEFLVACAGLAVPLGGGSYDVSCASCQGSVHFALGSDTGPCPTTDDQCFLAKCSDALKGDPVSL